MIAYISIPITDLIIIFGLLLALLLLHFCFSETKVINMIYKLDDLTEEEATDICNYIIEILSQEYRVINPKFVITNYKQDEIDIIKYSNGRTLAFFSGKNNLISLQLKVLIEEGCTLCDMIDCIAHEFQHYLDRLSFETSDQWLSAYKKNINYYEFKANKFASKKLKRLTKNLLRDSLKEI
ncbi:hypothetical protein OAS45_02685 [Polaribacter sp.]|nr:hypothetical protein [Polaribacter sp.]MDC1374790.1 hypothetical protein [Polaribacter sp.]